MKSASISTSMQIELVKDGHSGQFLDHDNGIAAVKMGSSPLGADFDKCSVKALTHYWKILASFLN